MSTHEYP